MVPRKRSCQILVIVVFATFIFGGIILYIKLIHRNDGILVDNQEDIQQIEIIQTLDPLA